MDSTIINENNDISLYWFLNFSSKTGADLFSHKRNKILSHVIHQQIVGENIFFSL